MQTLEEIKGRIRNYTYRTCPAAQIGRTLPFYPKLPFLFGCKNVVP